MLILFQVMNMQMQLMKLFQISLAFSIDKQTNKTHKETAWCRSLCNSHVPEQIYHQLP